MSTIDIAVLRHKRFWITGQIREIDLDTRLGRIRLSIGNMNPCESKHVEFSRTCLEDAKAVFIRGCCCSFGGVMLEDMTLFIDTIERTDNA